MRGIKKMDKNTQALPVNGHNNKESKNKTELEKKETNE